MRAVAMRVRFLFTGRWWSTAFSLVAVAVAVAAVLTFTLGAHRTATAADRYTSAVGGDAEVQLLQTGGRPVTAAVGALPGVESVEAATFVAGAYVPGSPGEELFAGTGFGPRQRVVAGRAPSPTAPHEFVATQSFLDAHHLHVGDQWMFSTYTQEQADSGQFGGPATGPTIDGTLVGVIRGASQLDDPTPVVWFSARLLDEPVAVVGTAIWVHLAPGTSLDALRQSLHGVPAADGFIFQSGQAVSSSARNAVRAQAVGLAILALVTALAVVAVIGQLLVRQLGRGASDRQPLLALGYTARQTMGEQVGWAGLLVLTGVVLGAAGAVSLTPLFPRGFVRGLDPDAGHVLVSPLVLTGAALLLAVLLLFSVAIGVIAARRPAVGERPSPTAEALARAGAAPSTVTGVRFALARGRESVSTWATFGTLFLATATVFGAVVFASSVGRLVTDPARFGSNFDVLLSSGDGPATRPSLDGVAGVTGAMFMATSTATANGGDIDLVGVDPVRGALVPRVLSGRFPVSADEIALGAVTAREHHVGIGDTLTLVGGSGTDVTFRIVGTAVIPAPNSFGDGGGRGGALLMAGLTAVDPQAVANQLALRLAPGVTGPDSLDSFQGGPVQFTSRPPDVVNLSRSRSIPVALAAVVGALGLLTLVHTLITSVRRRRRDLAVLRALGADRGTVGRVVHAQATTVALAAIVGGLPLGIVFGRFVFHRFADQLGLVPDATTPVLAIVGISVAALVFANLAAAVPGWRAAHVPVSTLLHGE